MDRGLEPTARLLRLLSLLQVGRQVTGEELAAELGCTTRTVRRDVERLRDLGYPIDATRGTAGYRPCSPTCAASAPTSNCLIRRAAFTRPPSG